MRSVWSLIFPGLGERYFLVLKGNEKERHLAQNPVCTSKYKGIEVLHHFLGNINVWGSSVRPMWSQKSRVQLS